MFRDTRGLEDLLRGTSVVGCIIIIINDLFQFGL